VAEEEVDLVAAGEALHGGPLARGGPGPVATSSSRPREVDSPEHLEVLCEGLEGLQRLACITAVAVIGPPDPAVQVEICVALARPADAASCIRGTKVQNLRGSSIGDYVDLIGRCEQFGTATRRACYRWLGKTISVVTDGRFLRTGCPSLGSREARRQCAAGARSMDEALVKFS
jgi:hypothetical protein